MDINLVFDSSVENAPAGFQTALDAAADALDTLITNPITVSIQVGWGEDDGQPLGDALASGGPFVSQGLDYAQLKQEFADNAQSPAQITAAADLPAADPTDGGNFMLPDAIAKAWGLLAADGSEIDGTVGFSTSANWDYDPNDRAVPGEYDLVGAAEHELTHALGRIAGLQDVPNWYAPLDLFRYSGPGTLELTAGQPAYFSFDGGTTDLAQFATVDDDGDWTGSAGPDSFDAEISPGVENPITAVDVTELNVLGFDVAPCLLAGSRVLTTQGERAVETLREGDGVVTASGRVAPIVWIGERRIDCRSHSAGEKVWPVRIRAGAFGKGKPRRELRLSPDHAVFAAGVLIPVKHLVNGGSIVQEPVASVRYLHVELARHDILLAEGLEVESYLDTGNRTQFADGIGRADRRRRFVPATWADACAPLRCEGPEVVAVRQQLLRDMTRRGYRIRAGSELRVVAGNRVFAPAAAEGERRRFVLPRHARELRLVCETGVPAWLDPASDDRRRLGASIGGLWIDGDPLPLDSPALAGGFYGMERNGPELWRWTDGEGRIVLPARMARNRPVVLDLVAITLMPSWDRKAAVARRVESMRPVVGSGRRGACRSPRAGREAGGPRPQPESGPG